MRCALRKDLTKRPLCVRARLIRRHLERITAQERTLNAIKMANTTLATTPVSSTRSKIAPPAKSARTEEKYMGFGKSFRNYRTAFAGSRPGYRVGQRGSGRCSFT